VDRAARIDNERATRPPTGEAMKPMWIATAVLLAGTIAFVGCKNRKEEPVPVPNAIWTAAAVESPAANASQKAMGSTARHEGAVRHGGASGISWFQGTLEEAFSTTCHKCAAMFRR
jgi:hypothetical protein